jgi:hypothetical protein
MARGARNTLVLVLALLLPGLSGAEEGEKVPGELPLLEVGKVRLYRLKKRIEVGGRIAVQKRAIELFACCEGGKVHETVIVLDCKPSNLNLALLLLGLDDGGQVREKIKVEENGKIVEKEVWVENGPRRFGDPRKPVGDRVIVNVQWRDPGNAKVRSVRAEEMIYNVSRKKTMRQVGWIFTGSRWVFNPSSKKVEFAADHSKTIMTTYHDPNTILENPLFTGGNDELYHANSLVVPPRGTPVTLVITLPTDAQKKTALRNEEEEEKESRKKEKGGEEKDSRGSSGGGTKED